MAMNPMISGNNHGFDAAMVSLQELSADPRWTFLPDDSRLANPAITTRGLRGYKQVTDFHLLNLAGSVGGRLVTFDAKLVSGLAAKDRSLVHALR
ncbi:MAG: hypothetical protein LBH13_09540 [Cellulomonadaceae bacterium]|jgi:hypothetical protein|nr:hypothetical protein [Cellulomonadaceae bacterium]